MDPRFQDYGYAVCKHIRHATGKELEAIRKELADHMEDHAQTLIDGGFPEDYAYRVALESMGEAETVGQELNKEYPLRWVALATIFNIILVVLILSLVILSNYWNPNHLGHTLEARTDPISGHKYIPTGEIYPLEFRQELPGGTVLYLYGVARDDKGQVWVYTVSYPKNPLKRTINRHPELTFTYGSIDTSTYAWQETNSSGNCPRAAYTRYCLDEVKAGDVLTAHYDHFGFSFDWEIPWEEASP